MVTFLPLSLGIKCGPVCFGVDVDVVGFSSSVMISTSLPDLDDRYSEKAINQ